MSETSINIDTSPIAREVRRLQSSLNKMVSILQNVNSGTSQLNDAIKQLQGINETITRAVETQTELQRKIEIIQSKAKLKTAEERFEFAKKDLERKEYRYKEQYKNIVVNFVEGIIDNIEHFINLAEEQLKPLYKIIERTNRIGKIIEYMDPRREDKRIINNALSQFDDRIDGFKDKVIEKFRESENSIESYNEKQEEMIERFNNIKINAMELSEKIQSDLSVLAIPLNIIEFTHMNSSQNKKSYLFLSPNQMKEHGTNFSANEYATSGEIYKKMYSEKDDLFVENEFDNLDELKTQWKKEKKKIKEIDNKEKRKEKLKKINRKFRLQKVELMPEEKFDNVKQYEMQEISEPIFKDLSKELKNLKFFDKSDFQRKNTENLNDRVKNKQLLSRIKESKLGEIAPEYLIKILENKTSKKTN